MVGHELAGWKQLKRQPGGAAEGDRCKQRELCRLWLVGQQEGGGGESVFYTQPATNATSRQGSQPYKQQSLVWEMWNQSVSAAEQSEEVV